MQMASGAPTAAAATRCRSTRPPNPLKAMDAYQSCNRDVSATHSSRTGQRPGAGEIQARTDDTFGSLTSIGSSVLSLLQIFYTYQVYRSRLQRVRAERGCLEGDGAVAPRRRREREQALPGADVEQDLARMHSAA